MRDDFNQATKQLLAQRVGYLCSNPKCRIQTIGPSSSPEKTINTGVAAHICAASPGGPRYDPNMTSEERKSFDNGIWLCQNCAHVIDQDVAMYTVIVLKQWKQQAENYASQQMLSPSILPMNQGNYIPDEDKNRIIGNLRIMAHHGAHIRDHYGRHRPGYIQSIDEIVYNICVDIFNACVDLNSMELRNHMQLHRVGLDASILEIGDMLPDFYDENQDGYGSSLVVTDFDFINFFSSNEGDVFIAKCEALIKSIENM